MVRDSPWGTFPLFSTLCSNMNSWKLYSFQGSGLMKDEHHFGDSEDNSPWDITGFRSVGSLGHEDSMIQAPTLPYPMSPHSKSTSRRATHQHMKPCSELYCANLPTGSPEAVLPYFLFPFALLLGTQITDASQSFAIF